MKIESLCIPLLLSIKRHNSSSLITPKKLCRDCKYFIPDKSKCFTFGETDLVTGKNEYMQDSLKKMRSRRATF